MGLVRRCAACHEPLKDGVRSDAIYCHRPDCKRKRAYLRARASMERTGKAKVGSTGIGRGHVKR
jgi:hypothetical protein